MLVGEVEFPNGERIPSITVFGRSGCSANRDTLGELESPATDLFNLFTHELGHILGLGHSSCPDSLMNTELLHSGRPLGFSPSECALASDLNAPYSLGGTVEGTVLGETVLLRAVVTLGDHSKTANLRVRRPGAFAFEDLAPSGSQYRIQPEVIDNPARPARPTTTSAAWWAPTSPISRWFARARRLPWPRIKIAAIQARGFRCLGC